MPTLIRSAEIAEHLKTRGPWTVKQPYDNGYTVFTAADGTSFGVSARGYGRTAGRLTVSANWPVGDDGKENRPYFSAYSTPPETAPEIGVSDTKTGKQIAADIERRFFTVFLPLWDKQLDQNNARAAYHSTQRLAANTLALAIGAEVRTVDMVKALVTFPYRNDTRSTVHDIDVNGEGIVSLKLDGLSVDLAATIIKLAKAEDRIE